MDRFRTDNTDGYSAAELVELNAAWRSLPLPGDDGTPEVESMLDHCAEELLHAYDSGKRGPALTKWYFDP